MIQQLARLGMRVRAVGPSTPETAHEAEGIRRAYPEIPRVSYLLPEFLNDPAKPRPDSVLASEDLQILTLTERLLRQEPADLIFAGREIEARSVTTVAERHGLPWILRCSGYTLHLRNHGLLSPSLQNLLDITLPRAEATIVQAAHARIEAEKAGCRRIRVIPSLVDLNAFAPRPRPAALCRKLDIPLDARIVLHASNMKPVKRVLDVVESAVRLLAADPDLIYVVAGDGADRPRMQEQCRTLGIEKRFRFLGRLAYGQMPEIFALADLVVMCSEFEQQARVYLEAQASGRALISSNIAGAREVVEDGVTGFLYPTGDVGALAAVTRRALDDSRLRSGIEQRARARVQAHSLDKVAGRIGALMEEVVRSYRPAHV